MKLTVQSVLLEYDGPQIVELRDPIGGHYVGALFDEEGYRFLVAGVSPERLRLFRAGDLDLRSLLLGPDSDQWWVGTPNELEQFSIEALGEPPSERLLPAPDLFLHSPAPVEQVVSDARAQNALILEVSVEPPESVEGHRIRASTLAALLDRVQSLVRHAYGAAVRDVKRSVRDTFDREGAHLLNVVPHFAPGSFRVTFEGVARPGLGGYAELDRALHRIDALLERVGDPSAAVEIARENRGHLAAAYQKLLQFVVEHDAPLTYAWANPMATEPIRRSLTVRDAQPILALMQQVSNLTTEIVMLSGRLDEVSVSQRKWTLIDDQRHSGRVREEGPSLQGLTTGQDYRFECTEEIEATEAGRETKVLYLAKIHPLDLPPSPASESEPNLRPGIRPIHLEEID